MIFDVDNPSAQAPDCSVYQFCSKGSVTNSLPHHIESLAGKLQGIEDIELLDRGEGKGPNDLARQGGGGKVLPQFLV